MFGPVAVNWIVVVGPIAVNKKANGVNVCLARSVLYPAVNGRFTSDPAETIPVLATPRGDAAAPKVNS